ncbi:DUF4494 domain-containing protein [Saccharicrinis aurantiacus]|uniref:DUF4494 domain-containing protein n=1 Tax=Saccharicrinis aurantiacus TaxID=1849719 RepID=UPI000838618A|nr:DUF4494 domain-containing protein [Saccharicrinis aurantiacus]
MNTWFECKVKYEAIDEQTGKQKKVNLPYLIDAVSYTEAESRIHAEMEQYVSGEFSVPSIKKANYTDLFFYDDGDKWYKCKVVFVSIDEEAGKEKKVSNMMLVLASDLKEAYERINESMSGMTVDFDITQIMESPIADVFPYFKDDVNEEIPENLKPISEVEEVSETGESEFL